jgi:hypothetical protein
MIECPSFFLLTGTVVNWSALLDYEVWSLFGCLSHMEKGGVLIQTYRWMGVVPGDVWTCRRRRGVISLRLLAPLLESKGTLFLSVTL